MVRGGGGVPSVGHVGQSSVIIDGAGGTKCRGSTKCNYRWCGGGGGGGTKCRTCQSSVIIAL